MSGAKGQPQNGSIMGKKIWKLSRRETLALTEAKGGQRVSDRQPGPSRDLFLGLFLTLIAIESYPKEAHASNVSSSDLKFITISKFIVFL